MANDFVIDVVVWVGNAVYLRFTLKKGLYGQFLEDDMKTPLPRTLTFADDQKIWEMAKRGGFTLNIAGRQELEARSAKEWAESGSYARAICEASEHGPT